MAGPSQAFQVGVVNIIQQQRLRQGVDRGGGGGDGAPLFKFDVPFSTDSGRAGDFLSA